MDKYRFLLPAALIIGTNAYAQLDSIAAAEFDSIAELAPRIVQSYESESRPMVSDSSMYFTWRSVGPLGTPQRSSVDNRLDLIHIANMAERGTIAYADHASLGSPGQSLIYADRAAKSQFLFFRPYEANYISPYDVDYFNTKRPYSRFSYIGAGPSNRSDQCVSGIFTINATPRFNFGLYGDWINSYGAYESSSTRNCNAGIFGSYMGVRSEVMASIGFAKFENYENGGISDETYITNPEEYGNMREELIPVWMASNVFSKLHGYNMALNYKYHFGPTVEMNVGRDTLMSVMPAASIILDAKYESDWKRYHERAISGEQDTFYSITEERLRNLNNRRTLDSVLFRQFKVNAGLALNEQFNKLMKFGFSAYYAFDLKSYHYTAGRGPLYRDLDAEWQYQHNIKNGVDSVGNIASPLWAEYQPTKMGLGAVLSKHSGKHLFFNVVGEYYFLDEKRTGTSFKLDGDLSTKFDIIRQPIEIGAHVGLENRCPDFFEDYYYSNYFAWDNDFENKRDLLISGRIALPRIGFSAKVNYYNLGNYIFFDRDALPRQRESAVNLISVTAAEKFKVWWMHWDNEICIQKSSDDEALPLPTFSWYSNLYFQTPAIFKNSLTFQLGVDMRYYSRYYAQAYMPATGMFYSQRDRKYGEYPYLSAYAAAQLKVLQMYVVWNHLNEGMGDNYHYLSSPGYPMAPSFLRVGISVVFDD